MWPFRKRPKFVPIKLPPLEWSETVLKSVYDTAIAERDAANTQLERVSEKNAELTQMCQRLDHAVGGLDQESKRYQARIRELEAAIGPDAKALMDIASIITKRENERINTAPAEAKPTEPLPANDRNMSVFDTTNWNVTAPEHRRDETTSHPCNPPTGDDSPPVDTQEAINAD